MNLTWSKLSRSSSSFTRGHSLIHADFPIEQTVRGNDAETQSHLMQEPWSRSIRPDGTLFVADCDGLRLLARCEDALDAAVEPLQLRFGDRRTVDDADGPRAARRQRAPIH